MHNIITWLFYYVLVCWSLFLLLRTSVVECDDGNNLVMLEDILCNDTHMCCWSVAVKGSSELTHLNFFYVLCLTRQKMRWWEPFCFLIKLCGLGELVSTRYDWWSFTSNMLCCLILNTDDLWRAWLLSLSLCWSLQDKQRLDLLSRISLFCWMAGSSCTTVAEVGCHLWCQGVLQGATSISNQFAVQHLNLIFTKWVCKLVWVVSGCLVAMSQKVQLLHLEIGSFRLTLNYPPFYQL